MRFPDLPSLTGLAASGISALTFPLFLCACEPPPPRVASNGPPTPVIEYLARQEILTPLPLRVRLPARYGAERLFVLFRTWGSPDWGTMELDRAGQTWTGEISCRQVSTVTGDTKYFFLALDARGEIVAGSGSPEWPHVATIVGSMPDGPQSLPGQSAPDRCHDVADCPPDFPGCPPYLVLRPPCSTSEECDGGSCSWDGYCDGASATQASTQPPPSTDPDPDLDEDEQLAAAVRKIKGRYKAAAVSRDR